MNLKDISQSLQTSLNIKRPPVGIRFVDAPPEGIKRVEAAQLAGCGYWRLAENAEAQFYTTAEDHYGCPVGAHTHHVALPGEVRQQLEGLVGTMVQLQYLKMSDVAGIPQRSEEFRIAVYGPLHRCDTLPDVILVHGTAEQLMLLAEAAQAAEVEGPHPVGGRPTCGVIARVLQTQRTAASFGCVGNRVYTGLPGDEAYFGIPGRHLAALAERLSIVTHANKALNAFHRQRLTQAAP